jgi:hypothetical protein
VPARHERSAGTSPSATLQDPFPSTVFAKNQVRSHRRSSPPGNAWLLPVLGLAWLAITIPQVRSAEVILPPLPPVRLETGGSTSLQTTRLPLALPFGVGLIRVEFDLAVGTREQPVAGSFLDSFSLSFEPPDTDVSAFLFNHDARGETWFPLDAEGLGFAPNFLTRTAIPFPANELEAWPIHASYAVSLILPVAWQNCEAGIWLDLFDNRSAPDSFAHLSNLRLVARDPFFVLESSATPAGPFSAEMGVSHSSEAQRFDLMRGGVARFFRLRADSTVRLRVLERDPDLWRFAYDFPEPDPKLESAAQPQGPYLLVTNAVLEAAQRRFRLPSATNPVRFYRISASVRTALTRLETSAGTTSVTFEYRPRIFSLQSSAQPCGPFADDPSATFDTASQVITLPRHHWTRMFRVTHSNPDHAVRLLGIQDSNDSWILTYDRRPTPPPQSSHGTTTLLREEQP